MAELVTRVSSPLGPILDLNDRVPREEAKRQVAASIRQQVRDLQAHLAEYDNWETTAYRGNTKAKTFEEMSKRGKD